MLSTQGEYKREKERERDEDRCGCCETGDMKYEQILTTGEI